MYEFSAYVRTYLRILVRYVILRFLKTRSLNLRSTLSRSTFPLFSHVFFIQKGEKGELHGISGN